jgi:hypothetical protein
MDAVPSKVRIYGYDFKVSTYTKKIKEPKKIKSLFIQTKIEAYIKEIEYTKIRAHNLFTKRNFISTNSK